MDLKNKYIGFLGLGAMGFPMCYGLSKAGYRMVLPGYRRESMQKHGFCSLAPDAQTKLTLFDEMVASGAIAAVSQEHLIQTSQVILLSLPTVKQVEQVILAPDGILAHASPGTIVIDMTSSDAMVTRRLAAQMEERGIDLVDAPVSGGTHKAVSQQLTMMVGGRTAAVEACRPILETIGDPSHVFHLGPAGSGHTVKCINNFLSCGAVAALTEAVAVAASAGIDPRKLLEVINVSGGRSNASMFIYPNIVFKGQPFNMLVDLWRKDVNLFQELAKQENIPSFIAATVYQVWSILSAAGKGNEDCTSLVKLYEDWSGAQIYGLDAET